MSEKLNKKRILSAFKLLDKITPMSFELIVGGGSAMICSYGFPLGTVDVDVIIKKTSLMELDKYIKMTALKLSLPPNWLNTWFSSFTHLLPVDYEKRLNTLFKGKKVLARSFGKEDLLVLKCFAHRAKDVSHSKTLIQKGADINLVENHIKALIENNLPNGEKDLYFLYDLLDELEV